MFACLEGTETYLSQEDIQAEAFGQSGLEFFETFGVICLQEEAPLRKEFERVRRTLSGRVSQQGRGHSFRLA